MPVTVNIFGRRLISDLFSCSSSCLHMLKALSFLQNQFRLVDKGETADFKISGDFKRLPKTSLTETSNFQVTSEDFRRLQEI